MIRRLLIAVTLASISSSAAYAQDPPLPGCAASGDSGTENVYSLCGGGTAFYHQYGMWGVWFDAAPVGRVPGWTWNAVKKEWSDGIAVVTCGNSTCSKK